MNFIFQIFLMFISKSISHECNNKQNGFYCLPDNQFIWCYGEDNGFQMKCSEGTVCKCGYTKENPCLLSLQESNICIGNPGDINNDNFNIKEK